MSVRFKFRSSVAFDSLDLGGRRSISVRDLRAKIVAQKNLQICRDFDLVISDAETGTAFEDDEFEIKENSSVVIKRVPAARSIPSDLAAGNYASKNGGYIDTVVSSPSKNIDMENFDDFGVDLYPALQGSLPESDADIGNLNSSANKKDDVVPRCSETSISRYQNIERSDLSEAMSKEVIGENCCKEYDTEEIKKQIELEPKKEVHKKLDEYVDMPSPTMLNMDLPTELRCSLCNTIFKEAVMIPCCQHSFCDKCIRLILIERARCPKCSSMKCTVEDLLPNLSLRQAIEHFLESQVANNAADNIIPQYAPDGESGIHAKEVSYAISIRQKEPPCPQSPSATGKGSNQVMAESAYENKRTSRIIRLDSDKSGKSAPLPHKIKQMKGDEYSSPEALKHMAGFQGGDSSSKLPQNLLQKEEANMGMQKKKGLGVSVPDGSGIFMPPSKHRKGDRNCYMCGSPNHLIRDCPAASNSYPFNQTGDTAFTGGMAAYGQAYWHGASFPQARPYANIYGTPGMMPFDPTMVPVSPFSIPPYMSSMYAGLPVPYGFMRMGGVQPPMMAGAERPLTRATFMGPHDGELKHKSLNEHLEREHDYEKTSEYYYVHGTQRISYERRHQLDKETTGSFLDDDRQRIHKKQPHDQHYSSSHQRPSFQSVEEFHSVDRRHQNGSHQSGSGRRDQRALYSEKANSEVQDVSDSSNQHSREKTRHHHRNFSEKHSERRGQCASDCSQKRHPRSRREVFDDEKVVTDHKRHSHKHHNHLEAGLEPNSSSDQRLHHKVKQSSQSSRHSRQMAKSKGDQLECDRWEMVDGLDDDCRGERYYHKRKRTR